MLHADVWVGTSVKLVLVRPCFIIICKGKWVTPFNILKRRFTSEDFDGKISQPVPFEEAFWSVPFLRIVSICESDKPLHIKYLVDVSDTPQDKQLAGQQSVRQTLEAVSKNGYSFISYDIGWSMPDWVVDAGDVHNELAKIPQHIPSLRVTYG